MSDDASTIEHLVGCMALDKGEMMLVADPRDVLVYVAQGEVWVTEEGRIADTVLGTQGHVRLTCPGTAVVEALAPAILFLTSPHETGYAASVRTAAPPPRRASAARVAPGRPRPIVGPRPAVASP